MKDERYYQRMEGDLLVAISKTPISPTKDFHMHDNYEIFLFLGGQVNVFVDRNSYPLRRGSLLIFNNQEIHKIINLSTDPYERLIVHFKPDLVYPFCTADTNLLGCFQNRKPGRFNMIELNEEQIRAFMEIGTRMIGTVQQPTFGSDSLALTYLIQMLVMVGTLHQRARPATPSLISPLIQQTMDYIDHHLHTPLSLDEIANELSVDKYYLSHLFKEQTGGSLYRYVLLKKTNLAKQLLISGTSVSEACYLTGFNDYANFIRTFKNITGTSPGKYGKHAKSGSIG